MSPKVSFIVPCYNLAHFLSECVESILAQTFTDFEVLIMDDCSPDNTGEVAASFHDPRVRYIRNEPNLGHLRNYNKGIELSRGEYIWLISADDKLRRDYVLERYVQFMERNPKVGYVFCPGVGLENGLETGLLKDFWWGDHDKSFGGCRFLSKLLPRKGGILAPSSMTRKECYERVSMFPTDMPHQGDLYLWCVWALCYDVAYFAEPMVAYRLHDSNIMKALKAKDPCIIISDQLAVQWRVKRKANEAGHASATSTWFSTVVNLYAYCLVSERFCTSPYRMNFEEFESSLHRDASGISEKRKIRARVYAGFADGCHKNGDTEEALRFYLLGLKEDCWMPKVWLKLMLKTGPVGRLLRKGRFAFQGQF